MEESHEPRAAGLLIMSHQGGIGASALAATLHLAYL
jgi:hypothetical protein